MEKKVLQQWDSKASDIFFAELDIEALNAIPKTAVKYQPISEFPPIVRDVSLALKKDIPFKRVEDICRTLGGAILKNIHLIEEYTGDKIQDGHRGLVFTLLYQSQERTLREEEVAAVHANILKNLIQDCGAVQR